MFSSYYYYYTRSKSGAVWHIVLMIHMQKAASVGDMLATMKLICLRLSPDDVQQIDNLRFNVILRMLKSEHFNARMNALKEVGSSHHF